MNRSKQRIGIIVLVLISLVMLFGLDYLINEDKIDDPVERAGTDTSESDAYNQYGLFVGEELDTQAVYEDEEYIIYEDRILYKEVYEVENITNMEIIFQNLDTIISEDVNQYFMTIPGRIVWEEGYESEQNTYNAVVEKISAMTSENIEYIDVLPVLEEHSDEYLYFKTENCWTLRGSYYGMEALAEVMGIETVELEDYEEHMYRTYQGLDKQELLIQYEGNDIYNTIYAIADDPLYFYLLQDSENLATKILEDSEEIIPLLSKARSGKSTVIGSDYEIAIVEGDRNSETKSNDTILVLCDTEGQMIVPYLANYYEEVIVVPLMYTHISIEEFEALFTTYEVTDFLMIQDADTLGNLSMSDLVEEIYSMEEEG